MAGMDPVASLVRTLGIMRLVTSFDVGSSTLFIWDFILTFGTEVDLVWKSKWNFMKGLYFFQRYMPFIDVILRVLYYQTGGSLTRTVCRNLYYGIGVITVIGLSASEMILTLRTWAVWRRDRRLSIILPILYVLFTSSAFVVLGVFPKSITFGDPPYPGFEGCFLTQANKYFVILWVLLIVWDTLMLILILVPAIRAYRSRGNNAIIKVVYRDGVVYYLYLFVLSFINIIVVETLPLQYQHLLSSMQRVLHSILTTRVLLHIRAQTGDNPVGRMD